VLSLVMAAALLAGMRLLFGSRVVAVAAALGLLGAAAVLSQPGAGGSALVPANGPGYAWTFGPLLVAMVVIAWPTLPPRTDAPAEVPAGDTAGAQPAAR
jgi:N-acetyl-1-D-myo-inositol-2-amino-2-deoxy-alpha-D-glucopyranoside deacetylase